MVRTMTQANLAGSPPRPPAHHPHPDPRRPVGRIPLRPITLRKFKVPPPVWTACRSCRADRASRCRQHAPDPVSITSAHASHGQVCRHGRLTGGGRSPRLPDRRRATAARQRAANKTAHTMSWTTRQAQPGAPEAKETTTPGHPPANAGYGSFRACAATSDADARGSSSHSDPRPRRVHLSSVHGLRRAFSRGQGSIVLTPYRFGHNADRRQHPKSLFSL